MNNIKYNLVSKILQYGEIRKVSNIRWYASLEIIRPQVPIVAVISFVCINNTKCKTEVGGGGGHIIIQKYMNNILKKMEIRKPGSRSTYTALSSVQLVISLGIIPCKLFWWSALVHNQKNQKVQKQIKWRSTFLWYFNVKNLMEELS